MSLNVTYQHSAFYDPPDRSRHKVRRQCQLLTTFCHRMGNAQNNGRQQLPMPLGPGVALTGYRFLSTCDERDRGRWYPKSHAFLPLFLLGSGTFVKLMVFRLFWLGSWGPRVQNCARVFSRSIWLPLSCSFLVVIEPFTLACIRLTLSNVPCPFDTSSIPIHRL